MDELVWVLFVIGLVVAAVIWLVTMVLLLLLYTFLYSVQMVGHPLILLLLVMGIVMLARISSSSIGSNTRAALFGKVMTVRSWAQIATAAFMAAIGLYGVLVL